MYNFIWGTERLKFFIQFKMGAAFDRSERRAQKSNCTIISWCMGTYFTFRWNIRIQISLYCGAISKLFPCCFHFAHGWHTALFCDKPETFSTFRAGCQDESFFFVCYGLCIHAVNSVTVYTTAVSKQCKVSRI